VATENGNGVAHDDGWPGMEPMPDFTSMSDARLTLQEGLIDENIRWAEQAGDPLLATYYGQQMRALQAERKRRNGGSDCNAHYREETVRNKFQALTWAEFIAMDLGGQPFTIQDLLPDQGLGVIHGRGKEGKSTLAIHECRAVANGLPFLGKDTVQKKVAYINYEMPSNYLKELLRRGGSADNAYILNRPEPVLTLETVDYLLETLTPGGLMVIDSFRGAFRLHGEQENHAGGAGVILRGLQDIALKHKGFIQVIHHRNRSQGKEGTDAISGTSDWIAAPDIIWSWHKSEKDKPGTLIVEGRMAPVDPLSVELTLDDCRFLGSVKETQEKTDKETILAALTDEGQTADAIAEAVKIAASTCRLRLDSLFKDQLVNREGEGKRKNPYLWSKINSAEISSYSARYNSETQNRPMVGEALNIFGGRIRPS
jgi:hypothetical protein